MEKIMPLDLLSSIKGARSSEAVEELFSVIERASEADGAEGSEENDTDEAVSLERMRGDVIERCSGEIREMIRQNFPKEKNGYLVVPKVIED
jgi:Asp-tRNA(Asn)/Glu-tRNA(Gln) amidotransferase C subunit